MTYKPDWSKVSKSGGYPAVYCPDHPRAWKTGYIHAHVVVGEMLIGRLLYENEVVHHIDEDKMNYDISNLQVMTSGEHARHHHKNAVPLELTCDWCSIQFSRPKNQRASIKGQLHSYCGRSCSGKASRAKQIQLKINCKQ